MCWSYFVIEGYYCGKCKNCKKGNYLLCTGDPNDKESMGFAYCEAFSKRWIRKFTYKIIHIISTIDYYACWSTIKMDFKIWLGIKISRFFKRGK